MEKCMICGSGQRLAKKGAVILCRRCLKVIYSALEDKIRQKPKESGKRPPID